MRERESACCSLPTKKLNHGVRDTARTGDSVTRRSENCTSSPRRGTTRPFIRSIGPFVGCPIRWSFGPFVDSPAPRSWAAARLNSSSSDSKAPLTTTNTQCTGTQPCLVRFRAASPPPKTINQINPNTYTSSARLERLIQSRAPPDERTNANLKNETKTLIHSSLL